jgi:DNA-binding LacI/PurR family transcriptional regulator
MGAELGVMRGHFTFHLLREFPLLHMVAVDLWQVLPASDEVGAQTYASKDWQDILANFRRLTDPYKDRLTVLRMDTVAAADRFGDGTFDFVFIDAMHTYSAVKAEIAAWRPKVRKGGILCGHDYTNAENRFPGVKRAVDEVGLPVVSGADATWMIQL